MYFDRPTPVKWYDMDIERYGIAYKNEIICANPIEILGIQERSLVEEPIEVLSWVDFTEYIK